MATTKAVKKPHWYHTTIYLCPICSSSKEYRERRYGKQPPERNRFEIIQAYDYCNAL